MKTHRILDLEISPEDYTGDNVTFDDAMDYCKDLGEGWRLPTLFEFRILETAHMENVGCFGIYARYWAFRSDGSDGLYPIYRFDDQTSFFIMAKTSLGISKLYRARAVRNI